MKKIKLVKFLVTNFRGIYISPCSFALIELLRARIGNSASRSSVSNKQGQPNKNNTLRHTHEIAEWGLVTSPSTHTNTLHRKA